MRQHPFLALVVAAIAVAAPASTVAAVPTCFGKPATIVLYGGEGQVTGTPGDDVVVGSDGPDDIDLRGSGGTDYACGGVGDDLLVAVSGPGSKADGGPGRDNVVTSGGALALGGSGDDEYVIASGDGGRAEGGSGGDRVVVNTGATGDGGSGNDVVEGITAAAISGSSGSDTVVNYGGTRAIDCGSAYDRVYQGDATDVRRCEEVLNDLP